MTSREIAKFAASALALVAMAAVVGLLAIVVVVPRFVGGASLTVLTGSMAPEVPAGSIVVVEPVAPATLKVGDVITWQVRPNEAIYVTHRIIEINREADALTFVTQGDANSTPDLVPVPAGAVRGRVMFDLPFVGTVLDGMKSPAITTLLMVVGGLAIAVGLVRSVLGMRHGSRADRREAGSAGQAVPSGRAAVTTSTATSTPAPPVATPSAQSPDTAKGVANVS